MEKIIRKWLTAIAVVGLTGFSGTLQAAPAPQAGVPTCNSRPTCVELSMRMLGIDDAEAMLLPKNKMLTIYGPQGPREVRLPPGWNIEWLVRDEMARAPAETAAPPPVTTVRAPANQAAEHELDALRKQVAMFEERLATQMQETTALKLGHVALQSEVARLTNEAAERDASHTKAIAALEKEIGTLKAPGKEVAVDTSDASYFVALIDQWLIDHAQSVVIGAIAIFVLTILAVMLLVYYGWPKPPTDQPADEAARSAARDPVTDSTVSFRFAPECITSQGKHPAEFEVGIVGPISPPINASKRGYKNVATVLGGYPPWDMAASPEDRGDPIEVAHVLVDGGFEVRSQRLTKIIAESVRGASSGSHEMLRHLRLTRWLEERELAIDPDARVIVVPKDQQPYAQAQAA